MKLKVNQNSCFLAIILLYAIICVCTGEKVKELQVIKEYVPEECYETADFGDEVHVQYTGSLENGQVFDSSRQPNRSPLPFVLGEGKVIRGWEQGIHGMCVGERRKLVIPSDLGYGSKGYPPAIPPDATLFFDTELVSIQKKPTDPMEFMKLAQFIALPALTLYILYHIYQKYIQETVSMKEGKKEGKKGSKKRR